MGEISKFLLEFLRLPRVLGLAPLKHGISGSRGILEMERTVVPTSSFCAIPRPYRTEEKSSTRG